MGNVIGLMWYEIVGLVGIAGMAAGGFAWKLFQAFGNKAIDNHFEKQLEALRNENALNARMIQSTIDREIHRAKKIFDREFDALSQAWLLLHQSFQSATSVGTPEWWDVWQPPNEHEWAEFKKVYEKPTDDLLENEHFDEENDRVDQLRKWRQELKLKKFNEQSLACKHFIEQNGIFFSTGIKGSMLEVLQYIANVFAEAETNLSLAEHNQLGDHARILAKTGRTFMVAIEQNIHGRLWASESGLTSAVDR